MNKKTRREIKTLEVMIRLFCRKNHQPQKAPCAECAALYQYAREKIIQCKLGYKKTTCAKCSIHCFKPEQRDKIRKVMRYSGPKMITRHPVLALLHMLDAL